MMKQFINSVLVLGVCLTPLTVPLMVQQSWAQSQNSQSQKLQRLIDLARQQGQQRKYKQAIETWQQVLGLALQLKDRKIEAVALLNIGFNYREISQLQEALKYSKQALPIMREVGDSYGETEALSHIGLVYYMISQPQEALKYYNQALAIARKIGDRTLEAILLNNIKGVNKTP